MAFELKSTDKRRCVDERTLLSNLQCSLLAFLAMKCDITVGKQKKNSQYSRKFMNIKQILFHKDQPFIFNVQTFLTKRCLEKMASFEGDGVSQRTALRRALNEKKRDSLHILEDILIEDGLVTIYEVENREGIRGNVCIKLPDGSIVNKKMIEKLGESIWMYCECELTNKSKVVLDKELVMTLIQNACN
ncbi:hypothetical protein EIN_438060 [Entamoeba invadens IP1]|uniref:Uncharacterized protein n=1 Tax=Entamoeba invadens IP1 TaxID=370355 RepID=A0A0A1U723_ENTIV|nr:hypothetical protein EIN_438060 [Entamoeba invadens IP1]ELP88796.1 hypothetical protein EIN_438060 [Entamoeba invadens IP1]|eukprot:XP_004255567.1 hypothetical protein EIN_438060 [Entamoeba invadens IP1]